MSESEQITGAPVLEKKNTSFGGDVFRLVGGTVIAQIIGVITIPIISRFFGPEAYGTAALFTSITSVIAVVCCWRYELAIVIPEKDEEAASVFFVSLFASLITTGLTLFLTVFYSDTLFKILNSENLLPYKWFIPIFVLLQGCYMTFNYWNSRTKRFNRVALAGVLNSTITRIINIITGSFGKASGGAMIGAYTIGQATASVTIGIQILKNDSSFLKANLSLKEMLSSIKRYKKFPLISTWSAFMNTLSSNLPAMLLTFFFTSVEAGYFAFGYRLLSYPLSLIGGSFSQVFFQRGAEAYHNNQLDKITEKVFLQLITLGLLPTLILMIISPELFSLIFGEKWYEAGIFAQILAPWVFFNFICAPITTISEILNKQEIGFYFNIALIGTRFLSLYIGGINGNVYEALILYSSTGAFIYIIWSMILLKLSKALNMVFVKKVMKEIIITILFSLPILLIKIIINNLIISLISSTIVSILFTLYLFRNHKELFDKFVNKFKR